MGIRNVVVNEIVKVLTLLTKLSKYEIDIELKSIGAFTIPTLPKA